MFVHYKNGVSIFTNIFKYNTDRVKFITRRCYIVRMFVIISTEFTFLRMYLNYTNSICIRNTALLHIKNVCILQKRRLYILYQRLLFENYQINKVSGMEKTVFFKFNKQFLKTYHIYLML